MRGPEAQAGDGGAASRPGGRIRVVHVITLLELGGAQENTLATVAGLAPGRFEKILVSGRGGLLDGAAAGIPGCRWIPIDDLVREIRPSSDVRALRELVRLLRREKRDGGGAPLVVHTHSSKAGILGRAAARRAGADAVVHSVHGFGFNDDQPWLLRRFFIALERAASRWTDMFVVVAGENARTAAAAGIFPADRCRLIRSGFDTAAFLRGDGEKGRRILDVPPGTPVVGTVAVFKPQKAPMDFVAVARRVAEGVPRAVFVMVGDGPLRARAENAVAACGLSDRFRFAGWREEIPDILRAFDVFLLTSRWEGLPKVVPQALISGVPVVATAVDGTREIVDDGIDGILRAPGDVAGLAEGVLGVLGGTVRLDPGAKRERLVAEFDVGEMVRAQERLYEEILEGKGCLRRRRS